MSSSDLRKHWRQPHYKIEVSEVGIGFRTHAVAAEKGRRQPGPWNFDKFTAFTKIFGSFRDLFHGLVQPNLGGIGRKRRRSSSASAFAQ